jgi:hypothetical protein
MNSEDVKRVGLDAPLPDFLLSASTPLPVYGFGVGGNPPSGFTALQWTRALEAALEEATDEDGNCSLDWRFSFSSAPGEDEPWRTTQIELYVESESPSVARAEAEAACKALNIPWLEEDITVWRS